MEQLLAVDKPESKSSPLGVSPKGVQTEKRNAISIFGDGKMPPLLERNDVCR
jgi:hypothetical protein